MATIVIDNADKTTVELFRSVAKTQGINISVIEDQEEKVLPADPLAFNKALLAMPIIQGDKKVKEQSEQLALYDALDSMPIVEDYDEIEIFPRDNSPARDIDWTE